MIGRISRQQAFMETAFVWAKRSTCYRLNVGAVVVIDGRIVSHGYNGQPPGMPHCAGNSCPGRQPGRCNTVHAEVNALNRIPASLLGQPAQLYVTNSPCTGCADQCLEYDVDEVYFSIPYRDPKGLEFLVDSGIKVFQVTPAGYVVNWQTGEVMEA